MFHVRFQSKTSHFFEACRTYVSSPLVVSLSLTRKVPRLFCRFRRSLSESRRVIFPKYHLPKWATENQCRAATERHQQTDASSQMAGKTRFYWRALWKTSSHVYMQMYSSKDKKKNNAMFGLWKGKRCLRGKQGEDYVLFCLDGVWWSHVVAGDITALASRQGTSEPPIPFSVTRRGREKNIL